MMDSLLMALRIEEQDRELKRLREMLAEQMQINAGLTRLLDQRKQREAKEASFLTSVEAIKSAEASQ